MSSIFENASQASQLDCKVSKECDLIDRVFPIEEGLIPPLIELTLKDLLGAAYRPQDENNNASDDLNKVGMEQARDRRRKPVE